jgi:hypothetical protein
MVHIMLHRKKDWATRTPLKKGGESERGLRYLMKVIETCSCNNKIGYKINFPTLIRLHKL